MFLIRTAFWLALVVLVLPSNEGEQRQIFGSAEATIKDLGSFCARNPDVCERSKTAFYDFGEKAQYGAKMLMNYIDEQSKSAATERATAKPVTRQSVFNRENQGTLTNDDLQPTWLGSERRAGI